ncbi:MAG: glucose 1-dehydrogenase [Pseudomonadales bacterium]|nr:glucose 1-dehydrogenase [Pseudomonadales bacterium]
MSKKVAIITGSAQGMGAQHAEEFIKEGARVILTDVQADHGRELAGRLGDGASFVEHDVTHPDSWQVVLRTCTEKFGPPNVLVNNAGILGPLANTSEFKLEDYEKVCAVNQTGVFLGIQTVLPSMVEAGGGSIINISSIAGLVACYGSPNLAYVCSKFAVRGISKFVAVEYGKQGIRVNSIHPGGILTGMVDDALGGQHSEAGSSFKSQIPAGRFGHSDEVSNLAVFLASDEARFITGAEHIIDGGMTAM